MISWPSSHTSQPRPQAPSAGDSQLSSTKRMSCAPASMPSAARRLQVELLRVAGLGLEDDLVLRVGLDPVGVLAVAAVVGADARLDVGDVPRLGAEHAQERRRVHGARADLRVVGLPDERAAGRPELVQAQDRVLERDRHAPIVNIRTQVPRTGAEN